MADDIAAAGLSAPPSPDQRLTPVPARQPTPLPGRSARLHFYRYLAVTCAAGVGSFVAVGAASTAGEQSSGATWAWVAALVGIVALIVYLANIARRPVVRRFRAELDAGYTTLPLIGGDLKAWSLQRGPKWDYSGVWHFGMRGVHAPHPGAVAPGTYVVGGATATWTGTGWSPDSVAPAQAGQQGSDR